VDPPGRDWIGGKIIAVSIDSREKGRFRRKIKVLFIAFTRKQDFLPSPTFMNSDGFIDICVVWCGVVWCGVVWCGVVWCGVVWCGVVWCGAVWCGILSLRRMSKVWSEAWLMEREEG
jgi:hypothetical protein